MFKTLLRASLLLAPVVVAQAATPAADLDELHQRQFRYARAMMQLNQLEGFERGPSIEALLQQEREAKAKRADERLRDPADVRTQSMDEFAKAVERVASDQRAKRTMSRQWQIEESHPIRWSASANPQAAADCSRAIEHEFGRPLRIEMNRDGVAWLRVIAPEAGFWAFDTLVSEFDTRLSVYRDCRDIGRASEQVSDDTVGLGSIVGLNAKSAGQSFLIKLERKGGLGSLAIAKSLGASTISGRVTRADNGQAVSDVNIPVVTGGGGLVSTTYTNASGDYVAVVYDDGDYHVRTTNWQSIPLLMAAYPNAPCSSRETQTIATCRGDLQPISIVAMQAVMHVDLSLATGAELTGTVSRVSTTQALEGVEIALFDADSPEVLEPVRVAMTDVLGRFRIGALPARNWKIEYRSSSYARQRWPNVLCPEAGCAASDGANFVTTALGLFRADAQLTPRPHLEVRLFSAGEPLAWGYLGVFDADGNHLYTTPSSWAGASGWIHFGPIAEGTYRIAVRPTVSAFGKVVGGANCSSDCSGEILSGDLIDVGPGGVSLGDIEVQPLRSLVGRVTSTDGAPIANATVSLADLSGFLYRTTPTLADGSYRIDGLRDGYRLIARSDAHIDEVLGNIPCEGNGIPVICPEGDIVYFGPESPLEQVADFSLDASASVSGRIWAVDQYGGVIWNTVYVHRLGLDGTIRESYALAMQGHDYIIGDLPSGSAYWAVSADAYVHRRIFPDVHCDGGVLANYVGCNLAGAQSVDLAPGSRFDGLDFMMQWRRTRHIRVVDAATGAPLGGIALDTWDDHGQFLYSVQTMADGWAALAAPYLWGSVTAYSARVSTDNAQGYLNAVLDDIRCPESTSVYAGTCSLDGSDSVQIFDESQPPPGPILLALARPTLFGDSFE